MTKQPGVSRNTNQHLPVEHMAMAKRSKRGSAMNTIPFGTEIDPDLVALVRATVKERDITLRTFMEAALARELEDPTVGTSSDQESLYDVAS